MPKALSALILAHVVLALALAATYEALPDAVATQFAADGSPDAWESKPAYAAYLLTASLMISACCAGPLYLARHLPDSMIHLPNREHWLAPEHRDEAYDRLFTLGLTIAVATTVLFIALHLLTVQANHKQPPRMVPAELLGLVVAFLTILGGVIYGFSSRAWTTEDRE